MKHTAPGTTCPTEDQDAIKSAFAESAAWRSLCEVATEAKALEHIFIDEMELPDDGYAFTVDELFRHRVALLVVADPQAAYAIDQGPAQDFAYRTRQQLVVLERFVRDSERLNNENQLRVLYDAVVNAMDEVWDKLNETKGQRWLKRLAMVQAPVQVEIDDVETRGCRQQAAIMFHLGGGPGEG